MIGSGIEHAPRSEGTRHLGLRTERLGQRIGPHAQDMAALVGREVEAMHMESRNRQDVGTGKPDMHAVGADPYARPFQIPELMDHTVPVRRDPAVEPTGTIDDPLAIHDLGKRPGLAEQIIGGNRVRRVPCRNSASFSHPVPSRTTPPVASVPPDREGTAMGGSVAVIGGGPTGFMHGRLLTLRGISTVVLERCSRDNFLSRIRAGVLERGDDRGLDGYSERAMGRVWGPSAFRGG